MVLDIIGKGNVATGKAEEVRLDPVKAELDRVTPEARKFFETLHSLISTVRCRGHRAAPPWAPTRRRRALGRQFLGCQLARINTKTNETSYVPLPDKQQPYHVHVDKSTGPGPPVGRRPGDALRPQPAPGRRSICRRAVPSRATFRYSSATARRPRWCCPIQGQEGRDHDAASEPISKRWPARPSGNSPRQSLGTMSVRGCGPLSSNAGLRSAAPRAGMTAQCRPRRRNSQIQLSNSRARAQNLHAANQACVIAPVFGRRGDRRHLPSSPA